MSTLLTRPQLAAKIKAKYPEYGDIDDYELVNKVVAKHPEYGEVLDPAEVSIVNAADVVDLPKTPAPRGDEVPDSTADAEAGKPSPLWALAAQGLGGAAANALGGDAAAASYGRGQVKGLGQAGYNLWKTAAEAQSHSPIPLAGPSTIPPPPEMPEWLKTGEGAEGVGAFSGRISPGIAATALAPQTIVGQAAAGGLSGASAGGNLNAAGTGAVVGGTLQGLSQFLPPVLGAGRTVVGALSKVPGMAKLVKGTVGTISPRLRSAVEMGQGALDAYSALKGAFSGADEAVEAGAEAAAAGKAGLKPPSTAVAEPSLEDTLKASIEATKGRAAAKAATPAPAKPLTPPPTTAEVTAKLKAASTPQERGALIREWKAAGENVGEKLSTTHAEASPLDPEDLAHAKDFLKQAGGLDKALEIVKSAPGNSAAEIRSLSRALREAARAK